MQNSTSSVVGTIIQIVGIVFTIVSLSIKNDWDEKIGFAIVGMVITFLGRFIKEYEWLD